MQPHGRALALAALLGVFGSGCGAAPTPSEAGSSQALFAQEPVSRPLQVPPGPQTPATDYRIGPHDVLELSVVELEKPGQLSRFELEVSGQGEIVAPFVGLAVIEGKTVAETREMIVDRLSRFIVDPQVSITIKEYRSHEIGVMGAVEKPGLIFINRNRLSLVEALSRAGGLSKDAGTRAVIINTRALDARSAATAGAPFATETVNLVPLLLHGDSSGGPTIEPGYVIQVPPAEEFFVTGFVNKGGALPYRRPTTVLQAVEAAGGMDERKASPSCVTINRSRGDEAVVIALNLSEIAEGTAPDIPIFPGDSIRVGRTAGWAVFTEFVDTMRGIFTTGFGFSRPF